MDLSDQQAIIRRRFVQRSARCFTSAHRLWCDVGLQQVEQLQWVKWQPQRIVDWGARSGEVSLQLAQRYPDAEVIAVEQAEFADYLKPLSPQVQHCTQLAPLAKGSVDLILANFSLSSVTDLVAQLQHLVQWLRPGGLLMMSLLGRDSLMELRSAFAEPGHVHPFPDMHDVGDLLLQMGFQGPVMECYPVKMQFKRLQWLFRDLRALGMQSCLPDRPQGCYSPRAWQQMCERYPFDADHQTYPVSLEVIFSHAWMPDVATAVTGQDNEAVVSVHSIRRK